MHAVVRCGNSVMAVNRSAPDAAAHLPFSHFPTADRSARMKRGRKFAPGHLLLGKQECRQSIVTGSGSITRFTAPAHRLLLTHGYSSTSGMWQGQIAALSKHHKLVLWDMRGHGQSGYPEDTSAYSEALTVADMAALLDAVGAETGDRRRALAGRLHVAGVLPRPSGARPRAPDHRHRPGLQEGRGPRGLEQARARHRRPLRARGTGGSEIGQPRSAPASPIATRRDWRAPRAAC